MSTNLNLFKRMLIVAGATASIVGGLYLFGRLTLKEKEYTLDDYMRAVSLVESNSNPRALRYEPKINDVSYGEHQILTRTALCLERKHPELPRISNYGNLDESISAFDAEKDLVELYGKKVRFGDQTREVKIDGELDYASEELIKRVQKKYGLKATGKLDKETFVAIRKDRYVEDKLLDPEINRIYAEFLFKRELDFYGGNKDLAVAAYNSGHFTPLTAMVQEQLNDIYGTNLTTDGVVGSETSILIRKFQRDFRLNETGELVDEKRQLDMVTYNVIQEEWRKIKHNKYNPKGKIPEISITKNHVKKFNMVLR